MELILLIVVLLVVFGGGGYWGRGRGYWWNRWLVRWCLSGVRPCL